MSHPLLAALLVASATATAQTPAPEAQTPPAEQSAPVPAPDTAPAAQAPADEAPAAQAPADEALQVELERRLEAAKEELREEIRAQMATQSLGGEWQQELTQEKRKLELLTLDGYFRMRPTLLYQFNLARGPEAPLLFPSAPFPPTGATQAGANMRLRLEPTLNVSEQVRVHMQLDVLDNILLGSTPVGGFGTSDREQFILFSDDQLPPVSALNALQDSMHLKRAYGEVSTPVGILRFGRMGAHWGMGILRNDGSGIEGDFGDDVDRVQFVTEPFPGWYVTPMLEFNAEGLVGRQRLDEGEPFDLAQADDATTWSLTVARRDTEQQRRSKLDDNQGVFNYGLYFSYRRQEWAPLGFYEGDFGDAAAPVATGFVPRDATLYIPDLWARYEERSWRLEVELVALVGGIGNRALTPVAVGDPALNQSLDIIQFGGAAQGAYSLLEGKLELGMEVGFASGDRAPGFGNFPGRQGTGPDGSTVPGDIEGPQFACGPGGCIDGAIRNFRFNRAYRVDLILWRELIGGITDAVYVRPSARYELADGLELHGAVIYSSAIYPESTPSFTDRSLGLELNLGARYTTDDGFVGGVAYGILLPFAGLQVANPALRTELETAQMVRGTLGIVF